MTKQHEEGGGRIDGRERVDKDTWLIAAIVVISVAGVALVLFTPTREYAKLATATLMTVALVWYWVRRRAP